LPFALPTSVAGITLTSIYAQNGIIGRLFRAVRNQDCVRAVGYNRRPDVIGLPFVVRTVQPVLQDLEAGARRSGGDSGGLAPADLSR